MKAVGIDIVEIARFKQWPNYNFKTLAKIFSQQEIEYALNINIKAAERFASKFAAKESLFKALSNLEEFDIKFLKLCKFIEVDYQKNKVPIFKSTNFADKNFTEFFDNLKINLSISHSQNCAVALVIIC